MTAPDRRWILSSAGAAFLAVPFLRRSTSAAPIVRFDDPSFEAVAAPDAVPRTVFRDGRWCEGPCWVPALDGLVFSDVRANRMWLLREGEEPIVFREPSNNANGNVLDAAGRLVTCEHRERRVVRREADGALTILAEHFDGKRLNAPNDVAFAADGAIWFTDPTHGIREPEEGIMAEPEQRARRVYRIDPSGRLDAMTDALDQPNGIAVSADGHTLFVTETGGADRNPEGGRAICVFPIGDDGRLGGKRTLVDYETGIPDGLTLDAEGRIYAASPDGVRVFAPDGRKLGRIATANTCGNLAFGGADGRRLFIATADLVQAVDLKVPGIEWLQR